MNVLIPIEEGRDPAGAVRQAVELYRKDPVRVHLLNVRTPLPSYVARFIPVAERQAFHHENGMNATDIKSARLRHTMAGSKRCNMPNTR